MCLFMVIFGSKKLNIEDIVKIARFKEKVSISESAMRKINVGRDFVEDLVKNKKIVYGLTTGFGTFKDVVIDESQTEELQKNLIMSHAVGVGEPLSEEQVRAAIAVRINSLVQGNSGVKLETVQTLMSMLNKEVYPYVPSQGSVGSSGDLAPLSHIMLVLMGIGEAFYNGQKITGEKAMELAKIKPIRLSSKEGLALNNGTAVMTGIAVLNVYDAENIVKCADINCVMTSESILGIMTAFNKEIHALRPHCGQITSAANIVKMAKDSPIMMSKEYQKRVQDSYSIRCSPQVHGAVRDTLDHVKKVVETEINSVTDNPLIFPEIKKAMSGGNFHGEPIAMVMDFLGIAISEVGNISERRVAKLVDPNTNNGLPIFLIDSSAGGLNNGFMMPQYTAAALVSENKVLAHPASVDSIPTSTNQEDHVSMGTIASRKCRNIIDNVENILAIEVMAATQAMDLRSLEFGSASTEAKKLVRKYVPFVKKDIIFYPHIHKIRSLIHDRELLNTVESKVGKLG